MPIREIDSGAYKGAAVSLEGRTIVAKGPKGEVRRSFSSPFVTVNVENGKVIFEAKSENRKSKAVFETFAAHAVNMLIGVTEGFKYRMEVVQSHFPSKVTATGDTFRVENFTGEKNARIVKIEKGVKIKIEGKDVFLTGADIETLAKTAQKIEDVTKIRQKDHRTFQDGIYIMEKKMKGGF